MLYSRKRFVWLGLLTAAFMLTTGCDNPVTGGGDKKARVTIKYYVGTLDFGPASISVNGGNYCTMSKNSTKEITVEEGDGLYAEYYNGVLGMKQSRTATARDGLTWSIP